MVEVMKIMATSFKRSPACTATLSARTPAAGHCRPTPPLDTHGQVYVCFIDYDKAFDCVDHNKLWNILKETGISDHLTCLLRNLYAGHEATVRTGHETADWFQIGKEVRQGCILAHYLFNFYAEYIMRNAGLDEAQAGIKTAGRKYQ